MGFLRIKKIKGNKYAYIAENKWMKRSGKVKQTTKKYLGRVIDVDQVEDINFFEYLGIPDIESYVADSERVDMVLDVLKWELHKHGFREVRNVWRKDDLYVNMRLKKVMKGEKDVALGMNEGFLTGHTMSRLLRYKAYVPEDAYVLAKLFVEAGLSVPREIFVGVFSKYNIEQEY